MEHLMKDKQPAIGAMVCVQFRTGEKVIAKLFDDDGTLIWVKVGGSCNALDTDKWSVSYELEECDKHPYWWV